VKCSKSPQSELFAMALTRHLNLSAPDARVVARGTTEWKEIAAKIEGLARDQGGESQATFISSKLNAAPFLLLMQFVEGQCLGDFTKDQVEKEYFSITDPNTQKRFRDMGKLIALDMMTNNWDRFPYAWDNNGNIFNIMLQSLTVNPPGKVVGIDFSITSIIKSLGSRPNPQYDEYFVRIENLVKEEIQSGPPGHLSTGLAKVANAFWKAFQYILTANDIKNLRIGILEGVVRISNISSTTLENRLESLPCPEGYDINLWRSGAKSDVSLEFIEKAIGVFRQLSNDADLRKAQLRSLADETPLDKAVPVCLIC